MGYVIDIILVAVSVLIIFKAARNGLVKSVMGLLKGVVSLIAAYAFTPALSEWLYEKFVLRQISGSIADSISSMSQTEAGKFNLEKMFGDMPDVLNQIITRYGADKAHLGEMCTGLTEGSSETVNHIANYIADPVASGISTSIAFIVLFVGIFLALSLLTYVVDAVFHLPVLHGVNKMLGLLFGVAEALLFCVLLGYGASMLMGYLGSLDSGIFGESVVQNSVIMRMMSSLDLLGIAEGIVK